MLRLHAYTNAGREVRHPQAFVTRTAMNLAVDVHRHSRSGLYERESVEDLNLVDISPTPDEILAAEQRLLKMRDALDGVGLRTREIFFMHRLQGFSHLHNTGYKLLTVSLPSLCPFLLLGCPKGKIQARGPTT